MSFMSSRAGWSVVPCADGLVGALFGLVVSGGAGCTVPPSSGWTDDRSPATSVGSTDTGWWASPPAGVQVLDTASSVPPYYDGDFNWGEQLASGFDLDHDGATEWAASAPRSGYSVHAGVHVFEGRELVASRFAGDDVHDEDVTEDIGALMVAGGDTDGDGFGELLFADRRSFSPSRFRLVRSTVEADDVHVLLPDGYDPEWGRFVRTAVGDQVVVASQAGASGWRIDRLEAGDLGAGAEVAVGPATLVYERPGPEGILQDHSAAADLDGDGLDELVYTTAVSGRVTLWACPAVPGSVAGGDGCLLERAYGSSAEEPPRLRGAGDVDGDGRAEILLSNVTEEGQSESLTVLAADGSTLAVVEGTLDAGFGLWARVVLADDGPWLWVFNQGAGPQRGLFAFSGGSVQGELRDVDRQRLIVAPAPGYGLRAAVPHRATPEAGLQMVISTGGDGGQVYLADW